MIVTQVRITFLRSRGRSIFNNISCYYRLLESRYVSVLPNLSHAIVQYTWIR